MCALGTVTTLDHSICVAQKQKKKKLLSAKIAKAFFNKFWLQINVLLFYSPDQHQEESQ
jgi:hypothetical protein